MCLEPCVDGECECQTSTPSYIPFEALKTCSWKWPMIVLDNFLGPRRGALPYGPDALRVPRQWPMAIASRLRHSQYARRNRDRSGDFVCPAVFGVCLAPKRHSNDAFTTNGQESSFHPTAGSLARLVIFRVDDWAWVAQHACGSRHFQSDQASYKFSLSPGAIQDEHSTPSIQRPA